MERTNLTFFEVFGSLTDETLLLDMPEKGAGRLALDVY